MVPIVDLFSEIGSTSERLDKLDKDVKVALGRLLQVYANKAHLNRMKLFWSSESEFNVFLACQILQPLTGGLCIINGLKDRSKITNRNVKLPAEVCLTGIAMGM